MKKLLSVFVCMCLLCLLAAPAMAAGDAPQITMQPQSANYPQYATAMYTVKASGSNLTATWYLEFEGKTYNLSDMSNGFEPWEAYAGESYGPQQNDANTFSCFFGGIEDGLDGAKIWCVIEDGHYDVTSEKAVISVGNYDMPPTIVDIPAQITAEQGDLVDLRCVAISNSDAQLSYIWYETTTGKLQDIQALNRGTETGDYITCDTSTVGTRYYVCCVQTTAGGMIYSSVVPVTVTPIQVQATPTVAETTKPVQTTSAAPVQTEIASAAEPTQPAQETQAPSTQPVQTVAPAQTEAVQQTQPSPTEQMQPEQEDNDLPWWALVLIGVVGAGIGVIAALILLKKKS